MYRLCGMGSAGEWSRAVIVVLAALAFFVVGAGAANGNHMSCGDTITQDTRLDSDLIDCPGNGLVIGADGITLDLRGHTIDGRGGGIGVDNSAGHDGVTIQRGTIRDFNMGVFGEQAVGNVVRRLEVADAGYAGVVFLYLADGLRIERNRVVGAGGPGILVGDMGSCCVLAVADNVLVGNCSGIVLLDTSRARVEENTILRSGPLGCGTIVGSADGIYSHYDSGNVIDDNVVRRSADDGIDVEGEDVVAGNRADRNGDLGIEAEPGVVDGGGNRARGNGNPLQCVGVACS